MKQGTNLHVYTWSRTVRLGGFAPDAQHSLVTRNAHGAEEAEGLGTSLGSRPPPFSARLNYAHA